MEKPAKEGRGRPVAVTLPVNLIVRGRKALVVGGGRVALRKAKVLVSLGVGVRVVALEACGELAALEGVEIERAAFDASDVESDLLAVFACTDDKRTNREVLEAARKAGVLAASADGNWIEGDFVSPAVARMEDTIVAVSTNGAECRTAKAVRDAIKGGFVAGAAQLIVYKCKNVPDLAVIAQLKGVEGCMLVDTCERCEVWMWAVWAEKLAEALRRLGADHLMQSPQETLRVLCGKNAKEHIARVMAGLDSTLKGEEAIVGQVREAMHRAEEEGYMCAGLRKCLDEAFLEQKKLRKNGERVEEIEDIAVRIAKGGVVAVFGTGMVGKRLVERLQRKEGIKKIYWAYHVNRIESADERVEVLQMKECLQKVHECDTIFVAMKLDEPLRMEADGLVVDFGKKACVVGAGENYIPLAELQRIGNRP